MAVFFLFFEWKVDDKNVLDILYCTFTVKITPLPAMKADANVCLDVPHLCLVNLIFTIYILEAQVMSGYNVSI